MGPSSRMRTAFAAFAAATLTGLAVLAGVASAGNTSPWKITVVNSTGQDPANVYVALPSSGSPPTAPDVLPTGFAMDTAYALDPIGTSTPWVSEGNNRYSITLQGAWNSGTILYSVGQPYASKPTAGQNTSPYDFSELTVDSNGSLNGDISSVDQIGVPARLSVLAPGRVQANRDGSSQPATEYVGCVNATWNLLQRYAGSTPQNTFRTSGGQFLQLLGPSAGGAWANYPSFQTYVTNVARTGFTVKGSFAGITKEIGPGGIARNVPASTYTYTGALTPDGQWIKLTGILEPAQYANPMDMYVPVAEMWTHNNSVWRGANGWGVYRQNGPYVLVLQGQPQPSMGATAFYYTGDGSVPTSGPTTLSGWTPVSPPAGAYAADANDIYGWIYGDLAASFAMGYWGSNYGSDSSAWNTNANPPWGVRPAGKVPFAAAWANPYPGYPLFNVYQAAVDATGTTYGSPLNDRFTPPETASPEIGVTPPASSGAYTWQVELLAQQGCAQALSVSPASGPSSGGQQVTITGRNFHQGATVTFGGTAATNVQVTHNPATSLDTITATTPRAPAGGPVNVRVTNKYGSKGLNIDTSVLASAYAYPAAGSGSKSGGNAAGIPVAPGGVALGAGISKYPKANCSITQVVRDPMQAKPARAPKVTVPSGGIMALSVHGLPKKAEASIDIQVNGQWTYLGRVRSNPKGYAVLPRYAQTTRGQSTLIRARIGKKGVRYLRTIAGPPRDWGGQALSTVVTKYPVGTCPVHYSAAKKPAAASITKAPVASVPLGGITVVRVRGLKRNESTGVDVKIGSGWRFVGRVKAARNGLLAMPPVAVNQRGQVVQVRLRGDDSNRYVKLKAS